MARRRFEDVAVGDVIEPRTFNVRRSSLIRYAGASGDFNVIHWNERVATSVGLPNVIAHGMFTMAEAGRVVTDWVGDPGAVIAYAVRFSRPVVVPDDDRGTDIVVDGTVEQTDPETRTAVVNLIAKVGDDKVLVGSRVTVRLA
jgi:acyl dehydratase